MTQASYQLNRQGKLVGVLKSLKNGEMQEEAFEDLSAYDAKVAELKSISEITSECPYETFLREEKQAHALFDWSRVPESTMKTIMPHQIEAVNTAVSVHGCRSIVALLPGLGKTMIGSLFAMHSGKKILIVCPASKVIDWKSEYKQWTGRTLKGVVVKSFDTVKRSTKLLFGKQWDCVVVDECHKLKGANSDRSKKIVPLLARVANVIMLSGTPQENRPCELFNQLRAARPDVFRNREQFSMRYAGGCIGTRGVWEERGSCNTKELAALTQKIMYRNNNVVVTDAALNRKMMWIPPNEEQLKLIKKQDRRRRELAVREAQAVTLQEKQRIGRLRNTHANLMWRTAGKMKAESALERIRAIAAMHSTEKMIVFCYHIPNAKKVHEALGEDAILVTGSTPLNQRNHLLSCLRDPAHPTRFGVLSICAIGEGINLCPGVSVVVFLELDRVPARMIQAEKRAHRKGTTKTVTSYWIMMEQSYDVTALRMLEEKESVNARVLDGANDDFVFKADTLRNI